MKLRMLDFLPKHLVLDQVRIQFNYQITSHLVLVIMKLLIKSKD